MNIVARSFVFTLFVAEQLLTYEARVEFRDNVVNCCHESERTRYIVAGLEKCPSSERWHLQGYIEFNRPCTSNYVKGLLGHSVHLEKRKGSREQARSYCLKDGHYIEKGLFSRGGQGKRSDLDDVADIICNGGSLNDVIESTPTTYMKYSRGIERLHFRVLNRTGCSTLRDLSVSVHWGPPGTGKTWKAFNEFPGSDIFILTKGNSGVWFDGYEGHDVLLIDDFYGWIPWSLLLRMLDKYPCRLETKGGHTYANWTKVYITSNVRPSEWYPNVADCSALLRRIDHSIHFDKRWNPSRSGDDSVSLSEVEQISGVSDEEDVREVPDPKSIWFGSDSD